MEVRSAPLPSARAAVQDLWEVQNGFLMTSRLRADGILLPVKKGADVLVPLAQRSSAPKLTADPHA